MKKILFPLALSLSLITSAQRVTPGTNTVVTKSEVSGAIGNGTVTKAKIENVSEGTVLGRKSTSAGVAEEVNVPILLTSGTVSAAATLSIDLSSWYNKYTTIEIELINFVPATDAVDFLCRLSADGTTYDAGASNYSWSLTFGRSDATNGADGSGGATSIGLNGTGSHVGNAAAKTYNGVIRINNPGSSSVNPSINYTAQYYNQTSSNNHLSVIGGGERLAAQLTKGIRLLYSSGNISAGIYRVWGRF